MVKIGPQAGRRGLVIGAGAALGGAWAVGALCALAEVEGFDARTSDVVVGTSAGSVLTALTACGMTPQAMARRLFGGWEEGDGEQPGGPLVPHALDQFLTDIPRPLPMPGNLLLAARTARRPARHTVMTTAAALAPRGRGDLAPVTTLVEEVHGDGAWPAGPRTWVVAMDFDSGRRVVFGRPDAPTVTLPEAVTASCSAPCYFPPTIIAGRRYVDGGAVSVTNADVLVREGLDEVLVLAPLVTYDDDQPRTAAVRWERTLRRHRTRRLDAEVRRLAATGTTVRVLAPTAEDLALIGSNLMTAGHRRAVFETALRTTSLRLADLGGEPETTAPTAPGRSRVLTRPPVWGSPRPRGVPATE